MRRTLTTALLVVLAATLSTVLLIPSTPAQAHAVLLRADPSDGAVLALPPSAVRLVFNEPVDAVGAGLRVFAADGSRVDLGRPPSRADVDPEDRTVLAVDLPAELPEGGYVAAWRVRSADGHAVAGTLRFTIGDAAPVSDDVAAALADADAPLWLRSADRAVRGLLLSGLLVAGGVAGAAVAVARTPRQHRSAARVVLRASLLTLALVPVGLWLQAAVVAGATEAVEAAGGSSGIGRAWASVSAALAGGGQLPAAAVRSTGLVALAAIAWRRRLQGLLVIPAAALVLLPLASEGHQRSASGIDSGPAGMTALLPALDAVHVVAGALWIGAVLVLLLAVTRRAERSATDTSAEAAGLASRVGRTALVALGVVTVAGAGQAVLLIDTPSSLVDTAYGTTLIAKVALVAAAVTAAWLARRRAGRVGGWQGARRLLRVELALLGSAVLVTGVLVTLPPPVEAEAALFTSSAPLGDGLLLDVGVDGSRPGRTELHVYVIENGALTSRGLDVRATMTSVPDGIGPFRVAPLLVEPGHWFAALEPLPAGEWSLEVTVGLDRFTERTTTFAVPLD